MKRPHIYIPTKTAEAWTVPISFRALSLDCRRVMPFNGTVDEEEFCELPPLLTGREVLPFLEQFGFMANTPLDWQKGPNPELQVSVVGHSSSGRHLFYSVECTLWRASQGKGYKKLGCGQDVVTLSSCSIPGCSTYIYVYLYMVPCRRVDSPPHPPQWYGPPNPKP